MTAVDRPVDGLRGCGATFRHELFDAHELLMAHADRKWYSNRTIVQILLDVLREMYDESATRPRRGDPRGLTRATALKAY